MDELTVKFFRLLADNNRGNVVMLPIEMVDIIEGKRTEISFVSIDVAKVLNYLASIMEE